MQVFNMRMLNRFPRDEISVCYFLLSFVCVILPLLLNNISSSNRIHLYLGNNTVFLLSDNKFKLCAYDIT